MSSLTSPNTAIAPSATPVGRGRLALTYEEVLTITARLRAGRQQVPDAPSFRAQMVHRLKTAESEALTAGYAPGDVRLAEYAVVALINESALISPDPALVSWAQHPITTELSGPLLAGDRFFQYVDQMLASPDSSSLADLLEVYQLCLFLGFRGRYGAGDPNALHAIATRIGERVARLRGSAAPAGVPAGDLVPGWRPADDGVVGGDPWLRRLTIALGASAALALLLWVAGTLSLRGASSELRDAAAAAAAAAAPATSSR